MDEFRQWGAVVVVVIREILHVIMSEILDLLREFTCGGPTTYGPSKRIHFTPKGPRYDAYSLSNIWANVIFILRMIFFKCQERFVLVVKKCCVCYLRTLTVVDTEAFGVRVNSGMKF